MPKTMPHDQELSIDIETLEKKFTHDFAYLLSQKSSDFFREVETLANKIIVEYPPYTEWLSALGLEHAEGAKAAVLNANMSHFSGESQEYKNIIPIIARKNRLRHAIIKHFLWRTDTGLGLDTYERIMVESHCDIAETIDVAFQKWRENLFSTELGKKVKQMEQQDEGSGAKYLQGLGLDNQYSLFAQQDEKWVQVPLADALPQEFTRLNTLYAELIRKLQAEAQTSPVPELVTYFTALKRALACTDLDALDSEWEAVDVAWIQVPPSRLHPVHAMEYNYFDPCRMRVVPENHLLIEDIRYEHVNREAETTQQELTLDLKTLYGDRRGWEHSQKAMTNSHIGAYIPATYAGADLVFKAAGQSVPCREKIRLEYGSKISLNMESTKERFAKEKQFALAVFGHEAHEKHFAPLQVEDTVGWRIATHEVAHSAFVDETTDERIGFGIVSLLEEAKATWGLYASAGLRLKRGKFPPDALQTLALLIIQCDLRYLKIGHEATLRAYYLSALMELDAMFKTGLLAQTGERFSLDLSRLDAFYTEMRALFDTMVKIYVEYDTQLAKKLLAERAVESPEVVALTGIVNGVK